MKRDNGPFTSCSRSFHEMSKFVANLASRGESFQFSSCDLHEDQLGVLSTFLPGNQSGLCLAAGLISK